MDKTTILNRWKTILFALVATAAAAYAVRQIAASPRWLVDDAYILFRYAENLAEHGELTWNPGEDPVEGYTGVALVWLLAAGIKLGISPIALTHMVGILSYFLGGALLALVLGGVNLGSAVALCLYFTAPFYHIHAWSGLETTMFTAALLLPIYALTRRRARLFIFSLLLASFVRPEGILYAVLLLPLYRPFSWRRAAWFIAPFGIYFAWRWGYYGRMLPNTFYAKVAGAPDGDTLSSLKDFATTYLRLPVILALIFASWSAIRRRRLLVAATAGFTAICLLTYAASNLVMNFQYRFFVPFYALAILALGAVLRRRRLDLPVLVLVPVLVVPQLATNNHQYRVVIAREYASSHHRLLLDEHIPIGRYLKRYLPPDEWLVVHADAGSIPYYAELRTIDFGGLNDEFLSRRGVSKQEAIDYFFARDAGAAVFTSRDYHAIDHGEGADAITKDPRFAERYRLVARYSSGKRDDYFEFLYLRKDLAETLPHPEPGPNVAGRGRAWRDGETDAADDAGARQSSRPDDSELLDSPERIWRFAQETDDPELRIAALRKLIKRFPDDGRAPEAEWEVVVARREPAGRIEGLRDIAARHAGTPLAAKALFTVGFIFAEELADTAAARSMFERVIESYPESDVAASARWMLEELAGGTRPRLD